MPQTPLHDDDSDDAFPSAGVRRKKQGEAIAEAERKITQPGRDDTLEKTITVLFFKLAVNSDLVNTEHAEAAWGGKLKDILPYATFRQWLEDPPEDDAAARYLLENGRGAAMAKHLLLDAKQQNVATHLIQGKIYIPPVAALPPPPPASAPTPPPPPKPKPKAEDDPPVFPAVFDLQKRQNTALDTAEAKLKALQPYDKKAAEQVASELFFALCDSSRQINTTKPEEAWGAGAAKALTLGSYKKMKAAPDGEAVVQTLADGNMARQLLQYVMIDGGQRPRANKVLLGIPFDPPLDELQKALGRYSPEKQKRVLAEAKKYKMTAQETVELIGRLDGYALSSFLETNAIANSFKDLATPGVVPARSALDRVAVACGITDEGAQLQFRRLALRVSDGLDQDLLDKALTMAVPPTHEQPEERQALIKQLVMALIPVRGMSNVDELAEAIAADSSVSAPLVLKTLKAFDGAATPPVFCELDMAQAIADYAYPRNGKLQALCSELFSPEVLREAAKPTLPPPPPPAPPQPPPPPPPAAPRKEKFPTPKPGNSAFGLQLEGFVQQGGKDMAAFLKGYGEAQGYLSELMAMRLQTEFNAHLPEQDTFKSPDAIQAVLNDAAHGFDAAERARLGKRYALNPYQRQCLAYLNHATPSLRLPEQIIADAEKAMQAAQILDRAAVKRAQGGKFDEAKMEERLKELLGGREDLLHTYTALLKSGGVADRAGIAFTLFQELLTAKAGGSAKWLAEAVGQPQTEKDIQGWLGTRSIDAGTLVGFADKAANHLLRENPQEAAGGKEGAQVARVASIMLGLPTSRPMAFAEMLEYAQGHQWSFAELMDLHRFSQREAIFAQSEPGDARTALRAYYDYLNAGAPDGVTLGHEPLGGLHTRGAVATVDEASIAHVFARMGGTAEEDLLALRRLAYQHPREAGQKQVTKALAPIEKSGSDAQARQVAIAQFFTALVQSHGLRDTASLAGQIVAKTPMGDAAVLREGIAGLGSGALTIIMSSPL